MERTNNLSSILKILLIEDNPDHARLIADMISEIKDTPFEIEHVERLSPGLQRLSQGGIEAVLLDLMLPDSQGIETFLKTYSQVPDVPIIILSSLDDEILAVKAVQAGAQDYLVKGQIDGNLLGRSLCYAIKRNRTLKQLRRSEHDLKIRNRIAEIFSTIPDDEMYEEVLQVVLEAMESLFGAFGYIDKSDGSLVVPSLSKSVSEQCQKYKKDMVLPRSMWDQALKEKKTTYNNNGPFHVPQGHIPITSVMNVPIIHHGDTIGIIKIANKPTDYDEKDKELLETIAVHIAPVLQARLERDRKDEERKRTAEILRESKEMCQKLMETANDAILLGDVATGKIIEVNKKAQELLGMPANQIIGMQFLQIHPQEKAEQYDKIIKELIEKGEVFAPDVLVVHKDSRKIPVDISGSVTTVRGKKFILGIFRDITERKRAEEELKYKNILLSTQQETSLDGILVVDKSGKMSLFNQRFIHMWDIPSEVIESKSDERALQSVYGKLADPEQFLDKVQYLYDHRNEKSEDEISLADGKIFERYSAPMLEADGKYYGRVWYFRNITERKRIEEELAKYRQHLHDLVKERTAKLAKANKNLSQEIKERKRIENTLHQRVQEITTLNTLSRQINAGLSLDQVTQAILKGITDTISPDLMLIFLRKGEKLVLESSCSRNGKLYPEEITVHYVGECLCGLAAKEGQAIYSSNIYADSRCTWEECKKAGLHSFAALPLNIADEVIGVLGLGSITERDFEKQASFLETISNEITIGLQHAILFEERKQANKELRKFKLINDTSSDAHFLSNREGKFQYVNKTACEILGYSEEELLTLGVPNVDITYDLDKYQDLFDRAQQNTIPPIETTNKRKNGTVFPAEITVTGYRINGTPYIFAALRDVTERKKAEEVLKARQQEIEKLNANLEMRVQEEVEKSRQKDLIMIHQSRLAAMGEMIGLIAHQWRQPLNALNLILYNILELYKDNQTGDDIIDNLCAKGTNLIMKMSATIDDFRDFFKPNKGKEAFSITRIIKESFSMVDANFKYNQISVLVNEEEEITTVGFPNEYFQVILNILNNARDAIMAKGVKGEIIINISRENNSAVVKIRDNGGGITANIINSIFDSTFTTKEEGQGTGLGLYMSKVIIEDHMGGRIDVRNTDIGTEFSITTSST